MNIRVCLAVAICGVTLLQAQDLKKAGPDPVLQKYQSELDQLKSDYQERLRSLRQRMLADYEAAERSAIAANNVDQAAAFKASAEELRLLMSNEYRIVGKWNITQTNDIQAVWAFNKDHTYNYWKETGQWKLGPNNYLLKHTWDWEITMSDDDTFDGVCVRGEKGVKIHGERAE